MRCWGLVRETQINLTLCDSPALSTTCVPEESSIHNMLTCSTWRSFSNISPSKRETWKHIWHLATSGQNVFYDKTYSSSTSTILDPGEMCILNVGTYIYIYIWSYMIIYGSHLWTCFLFSFFCFLTVPVVVSLAPLRLGPFRTGVLPVARCWERPWKTPLADIWPSGATCALETFWQDQWRKMCNYMELALNMKEHFNTFSAKSQTADVCRFIPCCLRYFRGVMKNVEQVMMVVASLRKDNSGYMVSNHHLKA